MNNLVINTVILFIYTTIIGYFDYKYNKIFNKFTFSFTGLGCLINFFMYGIPGVIIAIEGILVGFILLFIPFLLGWVGGGDVKYLASLGALIGPWKILYSTLIGLILAGIAAIFYLIINKSLKKLFLELVISLQKKDIASLSNYGKLPLGVFLSLGIMLFWLYFNFFYRG